jgi:MFS family permease
MGKPDGQGERGAARGKWLALIAALLGWMFDGLEMGLFPLVARPALSDLMGVTNEAEVGRWFGVATAAFLVGAATGGVLFGWLGDRLGRVRAMTLSVFTYAVFTGLCGLATSPEQIAGLRFLSALGMGGEWALGVALVMEIWPDQSRAVLAGLIGAAANVGYLLVGVLGLWLAALLPEIRRFLLSAGLSEPTVEWLARNSGWRLLLLLGATPALLTLLIRLFVPESQRWRHEHGRGATSHWAKRDLTGVLVGSLAACAMIYLWGWDFTLGLRLAGSVVALVVVTLGYLYPVWRYLQRSASVSHLSAREAWPTVRRMLLGACLGGIPLLATWAAIQWASVWADQLSERELRSKLYPALAANVVLPGSGAVVLAPVATDPHVLTRDTTAKAYTQFWSALGAVLGCVAGALFGDWFGRRWAYTLLCAGSLASVLFFFQMNDHYGPKFLISVFVAGGLSASFYGWLPLYLPELFPTRVRATGQGFSYNFGRILAAVGTLQTGTLIGLLGGSYPQACSIMSLIYVVGMAVIWLAPETRGQPLPE